MTMYDTILLDRTTWDMVVDSNGNIAVASAPYALEQDVASAVSLFLGELWYDTTKGVPYFESILGQLPPPSLFRSYLERAALTVPGVVSAQATIFDRVTTISDSISTAFDTITDESEDFLTDEAGSAISPESQTFRSVSTVSSNSAREIIGEIKFIDETGAENGVHF